MITKKKGHEFPIGGLRGWCKKILVGFFASANARRTPKGPEISNGGSG